jgi:bis(5'-nucleosyl)-tetraphosphatase (symmetrical)
MARYVVGDIQGCFNALQCLLERVNFNPQHDELWSVGDLVNRGPQSLETLRFFYQLGDAAKIVLGNHDLHLLAVARGIRKHKKSDTLKPILDAPDSQELLGWLRRQPLLRHDSANDIVMVHAGLAPQWDIASAKKLATEISEVLQGKQIDRYLEGMYGDTPVRWDNKLKDIERWRVITNYFTRLRFCTADGSMDLHTKESATHPDPAYQPWFAIADCRSLGSTIVFGHWAALNCATQRDDVIGLDSGCVWGGQLTLMNLDTRQRYCCDCTENPA